MATSIIRFVRTPRTSPAPELFLTRSFGVDGRWSDPNDAAFDFTLPDGDSFTYTGAQMKAMDWWLGLPEDIVMSIEATIYPEPDVEPAVRYVARYDRAAGCKLIPGTRLSPFFDGEDRYEQAYAALTEIKGQWPDAGVFGARSVAEAERLLNSINPIESLLMTKERMTAARIERARMAAAGVAQ